MSEKEIPLLREFLYAMGRDLPHVRAFRRNVLKLKVTDERTGKDRMVIAGINGQSDLYCYVYSGRVIEVELKSEKGRLRPEQKAWRDWCLAGQIPWLCLWPWQNETKEETVRRWVSAISLVAGPFTGQSLVPVGTEQTSEPESRPTAERGPTPTTLPALLSDELSTDRTPLPGSPRSRDLRGSGGPRRGTARNRSGRSG